jgi:hypothetical protein
MYEIWIKGYDHKHGGNRALHVLRDELIKRDLEAWMSYEKHDPNAIGVYPEIVPDNPNGYQKIVRWKLNTANLPADPTWAWELGMGDYPLLTVNIIDLDLFRPRGLHRKSVAYWVGKGKRNEQFIPDIAEEIHRANHPDRTELAEYISGLDYLISFDVFSAINVEAVLSGTPVLMRGTDETFSREVIEAIGWTPYGIAWSMSELDEARRTVHLARDHYKTLLPVFDKRVDDFVEATCDW